MTTVSASTSLILVTTSNNTGPYTVNFPNISTTGRIITVRDNDGFASTSNAIVLQPISGATFQGVSGTLTINQPFGFITLNSQANGVYGILNTFAFPAGSATANVSNVVASNVTANTFQASTLIAQSTVQLRDRATGVFNSLFTSSGQLILNNSFVGQVSAADLTSTVNGLGTAGYLSTAPTFVSTQSISSLQTNFLSAGSMTVGSFNPALINTSLVITSVLSAGLTNISSLRTNARRIALGSNAATAGTAQGIDSVAIGTAAANQSQGATAVAIGSSAGTTSQSQNGVAIGTSAGATIQGANSVAVGYFAGLFQQGASAVSIGDTAGTFSQGTRAVAVGVGAGSNTQAASAVAIGDSAGYSVQGTGSVAIGQGASFGGQGANSVSIGHDTGQTSQGTQAVAIGYNAGKNSQGANSVAVGLTAGSNTQGTNAVAIGNNAGASSQGGNAIAIGINAATTSQGINGIAIGNGAADISAQGTNAIAIGSSAGKVAQGAGALSFGNNAGFSNQGVASIAFGSNAGSNFQNLNSIAVGIFAGSNRQGSNAIAIGTNAGSQLQSTGSVAIGFTAGQTTQSSNAVALGFAAGNSAQGTGAIGIGYFSGRLNQTQYGIAMGYQAGETTQGEAALALGVYAGQTSQQTGATAVGLLAGQISQGQNAIAVGREAAVNNQGAFAVAVGAYAGSNNQSTNTIVLNASGAALNTTASSATYIKPIRQNLALNSNMGALYYTSTTGELTFGPTIVSTFSSVTVANNVGIGIANPSFTLDIFGGSNRMTQFGSAIQTSDPALRLQNTNGGRRIDLYTNLGVGNYTTLASSGDMGLIFSEGTTGTGNLIIAPWTSGTNGMKIMSNGNVGIAIASPAYPLDVTGQQRIVAQGSTSLTAYGNNGASETLMLFSPCNAYQGGTATLFFGLNGINNYPLARIVARDIAPPAAAYQSELLFQTNNLGTSLATRMIINRDGNVGIAIASPATRLVVNNPGTTALTGLAVNSSDVNIIIGHQGGGNVGSIQVTSGGSDSAIGTTPYTLGIQPLGGTTTFGGNVGITGTLSKGGGSFEIQHPVLKNSTLVHSFIEGPRCDLIYRGKKQLSSGMAIVDLEKESTGNGATMAPGTFAALCTNPQTYLQNNQTFDRVIGSVSANILTIRSENQDSKAAIDWMVIAERHDPFIKTWDRTDSNGLLILEHAKA